MWVFMVGGPALSDAQGNALELGAQVSLYLKFGKIEQQIAQVKFQMCSMKQPILSLGKLSRQSVIINPDGRNPYMQVGANMAQLKWIRNSLWVGSQVFWNASSQG